MNMYKNVIPFSDLGKIGQELELENGDKVYVPLEVTIPEEAIKMEIEIDEEKEEVTYTFYAAESKV